jgi:hypothetical protein
MPPDPIGASIRRSATAYSSIPTALVIGDVVLGGTPRSGRWRVVRGDVNHIRIGARSNVQDGSVLHVSRPYPGNDAGWPTAHRRRRGDRPQGDGARLHDRQPGAGRHRRDRARRGRSGRGRRDDRGRQRRHAGQAPRVRRALRRQSGAPRPRAHGGRTRASRSWRAFYVDLKNEYRRRNRRPLPQRLEHRGVSGRTPRQSSNASAACSTSMPQPCSARAAPSRFAQATNAVSPTP